MPTACGRKFGLSDFKITPKGSRTPVLALRGLCPRPLDDGGRSTNSIRFYTFSIPHVKRLDECSAGSDRSNADWSLPAESTSVKEFAATAPADFGSVSTAGAGPGLQNQRGVGQPLSVGSIPIHSRPSSQSNSALRIRWSDRARSRYDPHMQRLPTTAEMHRAVQTRDAAYDGLFFVAVRSTGILCRPSCASRPAKPANRAFF